MPKTVIAIHSIVYVPEGATKQETAAPGTKIKVSDADYDSLLALGAAKDAPAKSEPEPKVEAKPASEV